MLLIHLAALALGDPVRLDAGTWASPVLEGFVALHPEGSEDPRVRWVVPPNQAFAGDYPDSMAGDGVAGGTLQLDLSPGPWVGWVMLGRDADRVGEWVGAHGLRADGQTVLEVAAPEAWEDFRSSPAYAASPRPVFRPGETAWDRQVAPAHPWRRFAIEVGEEGVRLEAFGRPLQGLILAPADDEAAAEALVEAARAACRDDWVRFHDPLGPSWRAPVLTAPVMTTFDVDPSPEAAAPSLSLILAAGERVGRVIWMPNDHPVTWSVEGLDGLQVEGMEVSWLDGAGHASRTLRPRPMVTIPSEGALSGGQGTPVGLGLVLKVPEDHPPGRVRGTLTLVQDGQTLRVPVKVRVRDLVLPEPPFPMGFIAQLDQAALQLGGREAALERFDRDVARMRAVGATALSIRFTLWPDAWRGELPDTDTFEEVARRWAAAGGRELVWADPKVRYRGDAYLQDGPVLDTEQVPALAALFDAARQAPLPVVVPMWEEEGGFHDVGAVARGRLFAEALHEVVPGVPLAATAGHPADRLIAGAFDVVLVGDAPTLRRASMVPVLAAGSRAWAYNLSPGRSGPLTAWSAGAEAFLQWHWTARSSDPFDLVHVRSPWLYAFGAPDGSVWGTSQLERFAEGIVDVRALAALQDQVDRIVDPARTVRARALIEAARAALDGGIRVDAWDGEVLPPEAMEALRAAILDEAERLAARP